MEGVRLQALGAGRGFALSLNLSRDAAFRRSRLGGGSHPGKADEELRGLESDRHYHSEFTLVDFFFAKCSAG
ncbi:hypothetical protein [Paraburkholderia caribensis]|uniref:hypothetical protein n=1 Tax=Paraburkholderia caribensis TaxID=75105 RepID=UPI0031E49687